MTTETETQQSVYVPSYGEFLDNETDFYEVTDAVGAARSARNILQWKAYLPRDCIKRMIAMGWDRTT
jgi:hypothetical protein